MSLTNLRTGILVLLFVSILVLSASLYFIHKDVRNMKMAISANAHDTVAVHNLLNSVGLSARSVPPPPPLDTIPEGNEDECCEEHDEEHDEEQDEEPVGEQNDTGENIPEEQVEQEDVVQAEDVTVESEQVEHEDDSSDTEEE